MKLGKITQNSKQRSSACLRLAARSPQSFCTLYKMASITLDRSIARVNGALESKCAPLNFNRVQFLNSVKV